MATGSFTLEAMPLPAGMFELDDLRLMDANSELLRALALEGTPWRGRTLEQLGFVTTADRASPPGAEGPADASVLQLHTAMGLRFRLHLAPGPRGCRTEHVGIAVRLPSPDEAHKGAADREEQLAGIVETAMDAVITVDTEHRIRLFNAAASRIFRIDAAQAIGSPLERFVPLAARSVHGEHLRHFAKTGSTSRRMGALHVLRGQRADGSSFPIEASISKHGEGAQLLMTAVLRDMSDADEAAHARRAQLAAEAASRAKTAFISRMSHELRTPLNAVLGFLQLLQDDPRCPPSPVQRGHLTAAREAGVQLLELMDDLLDLSRIESGELRIEAADVDLAQVADSACRVMETAARAAGVKLRAEGLHGLAVRADATRLRQVLVNLVSNGAKYNRPGGEVRLRASPAGETVVLEIADNGIGMDAEQCAHLFEPFNRLGREAGPVSGTGIGLVLSRQLIQAMGGSIDVRSAAGQGTCVRITLPGRRMAVAAPSAAEAPRPVGGLRGRVLYIEDNPVNRVLIQHFLARWEDVHLQQAATGADGLSMASADPPDLVLLDLHLPDMDGHSLLRSLRAMPRLADVPVVILSAETDDGVVDAALRAGASDYWTKPLDFQHMAKGLEKHLGNV